MDRKGTPNSASVWKRLPIHLACAHGAPVRVIAALLQTYPTGIIASDPYDGSTPLHIGCRSAAAPCVIQEIIGQCPHSTKAVNKFGQIPLHVAVISAASYDVIETLVEEDPPSVACPDFEGKTPIDYAKQIFGMNTVVYELLSQVDICLKQEPNDWRPVMFL
jgi:ankyrin repeat protein